MTVLQRIVSGGQTGVDRAALDAAIAHDMPHGGWCPKGRRAEDGALPARYQLRESESPDYAVRTELNVKDSDGTLILCPGRPEGGTALTALLARQYERPCLIVDLDMEPDPDAIRDWIAGHGIAVLNVAGPRESKRPGIYRNARAVMEALLGGPA